MSVVPNRHDPSCSCCQAVKPGTQTLDELSFLKSACAAAKAGDCEKLAAMLRKNPGLVHSSGFEGGSGYTPLHYAARNGHFNAVNLLLESGADPNGRTAAGQASSLHRAGYMGHTGIIRELIHGGADGLLQDADGETPLHKAAAQGHEDAADLLAKEFPAAVSMRDRNGLTPQQRASMLSRSPQQ